MENSHAFLPKLCDKKKLNDVRSYCENFIKYSPEISYWKDIHLKEKIFQNLLPNDINKILCNLLKTKDFFLETVELHIQKPNCDPIPPHQDNFYHCNEYNKSLKILIPLQYLNSRNGGLIFFDCLKDHKILPHKASKTLNFSSYIDNNELSKLDLKSTSYEYQLGDASYHFINNIHYSKGNNTKNQTMFLVFRYLTCDATQDKKALKDYNKCYAIHQKNLNEFK